MFHSKLKWLLIGLSCSFLVFSCGKDKAEENEVVLEDSTSELIEDSGFGEEENYDGVDSTSSSASEYNSGVVSEEQQNYSSMLNEGQINELINKIGENPESDIQRYYAGIAHYHLMKNNTISSDNRLFHRDRAIEYLNTVGYQALDDNLKAKGLLWYAMAVNLSYSDLKNIRKASGALHRIQSTRLQDTSVYDDSLLYSGDIHRKLGWYGAARSYYKRLKREAPNGTVWNAERKLFMSGENAAEYGLEEVRRLCNPEDSLSSPSLN